MRLFRSLSCLWRDCTKLESTAGSLVFSTEAGDGEGRGVEQRTTAQGNDHKAAQFLGCTRLLYATLIGLVCHETPHCARNFMILTTRYKKF
jgi:hypothetical protein